MAGKRAIKIVGAGPAGLAAAIWLRREGHPVQVFDKAPEAGHRFRGDFQGLENWTSEADVLEDLRSMGIDTGFPAAPFHSGKVFAAGLPAIEIRSKAPMYYLVRRGPMPGTLDSALREQALAAGAELHFNHPVLSFEDADIVGTGPRALITLIAGTNFEISMPDAAYAVLDNSLAPGGYGYLLASGGLGTLAVVLYRDFTLASACLARAREFFASRVELDLRNERRFGGRIDFFVRDSHSRGGTLHVGEGAGFQDALWGFGMRYAITSGHLAARSIAEGADYDSLVREKLGPMLDASLVNRRLYEWLGNWGYRFMARTLARKASPRDSLRRQYSLSPSKRLLLPLLRKRFQSEPL